MERQVFNGDFVNGGEYITVQGEQVTFIGFNPHAINGKEYIFIGPNCHTLRVSATGQ